ncbi:MAG: histidine triad nucleotide-binding protein [Anaerolineae bacterium]|nr:histidine triad nucleotide-binding protein [Caldilineales bacterium]MCX7853447.1 histidine triad nucleotide-binding protein [Caldilineales bacterium]MDW8268574.1 histidine triad nucleotide-binding protein [Anaerolineae bacterium]
MSSDCIFCRIIAGEVPSETVYRDDRVTAFRDIRPVAPVHILIVPNKHIASVNEAEEADEAVLGRLLLTAKRLAVQEGIAKSGYRLIINTGPHAGQEVFHLHLHLIGGQRMRHPMG